ncbi:hypothetical protein AM598_02590, partial [Paenibacillus polymyxa]
YSSIIQCDNNAVKIFFSEFCLYAFVPLCFILTQLDVAWVQKVASVSKKIFIFFDYVFRFPQS